MAKPQGLTAEANPAARANREEAPTRPPRKVLEFPDSLSTNRLMLSMPLSPPTIAAPTKATVSATAATTNGSARPRQKRTSRKEIPLNAGGKPR